MAIEAVVFDLDGVVRHFDDDRLAEVERNHQLAPGAIPEVAFESALLLRLTTGEISRAEWGEAVGERLASPAAAAAWLADRGEVDHSLVEVIDALRSLGLTVALLTNGTDTIADELVTLGLIDHFDRVFNSSEIGIAKPDSGVFEHVCEQLDLGSGNVYFTDDRLENVAGALDVGMVAHHYIGVEALKSDLIAVGIEL